MLVMASPGACETDWWVVDPLWLNHWINFKNILLENVTLNRVRSSCVSTFSFLCPLSQNLDAHSTSVCVCETAPATSTRTVGKWVGVHWPVADVQRGHFGWQLLDWWVDWAQDCSVRSHVSQKPARSPMAARSPPRQPQPGVYDRSVVVEWRRDAKLSHWAHTARLLSFQPGRKWCHRPNDGPLDGIWQFRLGPNHLADAHSQGQRLAATGKLNPTSRAYPWLNDIETNQTNNYSFCVGLYRAAAFDAHDRPHLRSDTRSFHRRAQSWIQHWYSDVSKWFTA